MVTVTTKPCMLCQASTIVEITEAEQSALDSGAYIQDALSSRPEAFRELLITGTHGDCWNTMFPEEEEEEED